MRAAQSGAVCDAACSGFRPVARSPWDGLISGSTPLTSMDCNWENLRRGRGKGEGDGGRKGGREEEEGGREGGREV